ncbi:MAG: hypothetical protein ACLFNB_02420 [Candidatus Woesearchaeota archaeon]
MKQNANNKAQITVFVIIGAVLLLSVALFIFLNQDIQSDKPAVDVPDVSLEARPVNELITQCLETTSEEALYKVGLQGGYTEPLAASHPPHEGEAVEYTPFSVPYWRHLTDNKCSNPSGCDATNQPELCDSVSDTCNYDATSRTSSESIEENLEQYVLDNIDSCIDDFSSLDMYEIEENGDPSVNTILANGKTDFVLNYPIEIRSLTQEGNKKEVERFRASFDVDLVNMYRFADEIMAYEREYNIYETKTMDLVNMYAGLDSELPPTSELRFFKSQKGPWIQTRVKQLLQSEVLPYMVLMSVMNSDNPMIIQRNNESDPYNPYSQGIYQGFVFGTSEKKYPFNVNHKYLFSPIHLMIDNGDQLIRGKDLMPSGNSDTGAMLDVFFDMASLGLTDYRFQYDISYPLVIEITDQEALNGKGYTFQFATEVNVRNNEPGYDNFTQITYPTELKSNIGDYHFRPEQNVTIKTYDKHTEEPLEDVTVSYTCGDEYDIGTTVMNDDGVARMTERFPYCEFGGFITVKKLGYMGTSVNYNNLQNGDNEEFEIGLWPTKEKDVIVKARSPDNISELENNPQDFMLNYADAAHLLNKDQNAFLIINREPTTPYDTSVPVVGFAQFVGKNSSVYSDMNKSFEQLDRNLDDIYDSGDMSLEESQLADKSLEESKTSFQEISESDLEKMQSHTMEFVPGNYSVDLTLLNNKQISLKEYDDGDVEYSPINLTTWLQGSNNLTFTLTEEEVYNNDSITFFVLEMPLPVAWTEDELQERCQNAGLLTQDQDVTYCDLVTLLEQDKVSVMKNIPDPEEYQQDKEELIKPVVG